MAKLKIRNKKDFWFNTYTGQKVYLIEPDPATLLIADVAHHLSLIARFNGATRTHYSVAQHSVLCSLHGDQNFALSILMHDAQEAFLGDMHRPLKREMTAYRYIERLFERALAKKFGYCIRGDAHKAIKYVDNRMLFTESRDLLPNKNLNWKDEVEPFPWQIMPWTPKKAERAFLQRFKELTECKDSSLVTPTNPSPPRNTLPKSCAKGRRGQK